MNIQGFVHLNTEELFGEQSGDIAQSSNIHNNIPLPGIEAMLMADVHLSVKESPIIVSPLLFGTNMEHTRSCIYEGLSAQMLKNRKFVGKPSACSGHASQWYPIGERALFLFDKAYTRHHRQYHMTRKHECNAQRIVNLYEGCVCGIGQHEVSVQRDEPYQFRMVAKASQPVTVTVSLTVRHGGAEYASGEIEVEGNEWRTYEIAFISGKTDADADIRITFSGKTSLCIGAVSMLPADNFRGMRRDVIACLKEAGIRMLRWPGGNFAGEYNWLDGLLPVDMRAPFESCLGIETQPHSYGYDFHEINTDDFIALCREIGAEPYITINPCWNTAEENAAWVEYCNGNETTAYGRLRIERGFSEPYHVTFWSLGNEFGFGHMEGENSPAGYCKIAMEHGAKMREVFPSLQLCSSGPYPNLQWVRKSAIPLRGTANLISQHFYAHNPEYPDAENFAQEYYACLSGVFRLRDQLYQSRKELPEDILISLDEWNVWYSWYRSSSVTDGIFTALALHMIMSEAQNCGIALACHFEAVNEGMIRVLPHSAILTAQGQVFAAMKHHAGGQLCYSALDAVATCRGDVITITVINASIDSVKQIYFPNGRRIRHAWLYTSSTVVPPSYFEVSEVTIEETAGMYHYTMPAHSLMLVTMVS